MIISLRSRPQPGRASAVGVNGWRLTCTSDSALEVHVAGVVAILFARAIGPTGLAELAVDACLTDGKDPVAILSDARAQLTKEGRVLEAVAVQLAAVVLTPERTCAIAVSGGLPVYLISDGYAARIDPDVAQSNRVEVRDFTLAAGQQLLLVDEPLEDKGIALDWQPSYGGSGIELLTEQAGGFVVGVSVR